MFSQGGYGDIMGIYADLVDFIFEMIKLPDFVEKHREITRQLIGV